MAEAKSRGYQQSWLGGAPKPSTFAWIVALFAMVVQVRDVSIPTLIDPNAVNWSRYVGIERFALQPP